MKIKQKFKVQNGLKIGFEYKDGSEFNSETTNSERNKITQVIFERLFSSIKRINPDIPDKIVKNSITQIINPNLPELGICNRQMHSWITRGLKVTYFKNDEEIELISN